MENTSYSYDLYHWGIKGQKWGIRRYQNKDGSLKPAGLKRYNKEVEKLKKETAKVKAAEKVIANNKKVQSKFDKLEEKKKALEARKKALKDGDDPEERKKKNEETPEEKRDRLLKSTDPKELYEGRDLLSTVELNERLNRIDTEARLQGKIPTEQQKTGMDYVDGLKSKIDHGVALYKSVDNAYSSVANSAIGKTLAKKLGLEPPKKAFDYDDFIKNIDKKSTQEVMEFNKRALAENSGRNIVKGWKDAAKEEADEKKAKEAEKKAEKAEKKAEKEAEKEAAKAEKNHKDDTDGRVYGKGTSHSDIKDRMDNGKKWWDTSDVYETVDFTSGSSDRGRNFYNTLLLEDKSRR